MYNKIILGQLGYFLWFRNDLYLLLRFQHLKDFKKKSMR